MEDSFDYKDEAENNSEKEYDKVLRPQKLIDFAGQPSIVENLEIFVKAAKLRKEPLDHVLLHGPPGLGKTTLANIIANEMEVGCKVTSGPVLDKPGDLAGLLTNLATGDVIDFILKDEFRHDPMTVFFINKYGAQQTFIFFKEKRESIEVTDNTFESNIGQPSTGSHQFLRYNVQARTTIKASSGFITEDENEAIKQMMLSERVWMYDVTDGLTPLNIKTTSTSFKTRQKERLINYDIDFLKGYNDINNI